MSTVTTPIQQAYTASIALNNIAVSLVEKRCYLEAKETFRDAAALMKGVSATLQQYPEEDSSQQPNEHSYSTESINSMLRKANAFLTTSSRVLTILPQANLRVITEEESAFVAGRNMLDETIFPLHTIFIIRLEVKRHSLTEFDERDSVLESSIILFNFGVVHKCIATAPWLTPSAERALECYRGAYLLCDLAFSLSQETILGHNSQAREEFLSYFLPISILILRSLISLALFLGMVDDGEVYFAEMIYLQQHYLPRALVLNVSARNSTAAAA